MFWVLCRRLRIKFCENTLRFNTPHKKYIQLCSKMTTNELMYLRFQKVSTKKDLPKPLHETHAREIGGSENS